MRAGVQPAEVTDRARPERRERILPVDPAVFEPVESPLAEHDRPVVFRPDHHERDPVVLHESLDQAGVNLVYALHAEPSRPVGEVDEPQRSRGADDNLRVLATLSVPIGADLHVGAAAPAA